MFVKVKYLNNKELLAEIHKSKCSYSSFLEPRYAKFDAIVKKKSDITPEFLEAARRKKAQLMLQQQVAELKAQGYKTSQMNLEPIDPESIPMEDVVVRVMTFEHIPTVDMNGKPIKNAKDGFEKCNFPPFQHVIFSGGELKCVGKSHWKGGFQNGTFDTEHGKTTERLAMMYMSLVERYGQKSNWRGYTYLDEMKSQALLQLSQRGLYFDESCSDNPFAYYTTIVKNSFTRILNIEKKNQSMRDDILIMSGVNPSMTRQVDNEMAYRGDMMPSATAGKPGRKKASAKPAIDEDE
jgi:hypothetical protein